MKTLAQFVMLILIFPISYLAMVYGWGIQPANMTIIIASYIALLVVQFISAALQA